MIKATTDCKQPKVLVQKLNDTAYIFINLNESLMTEVDEEGVEHTYYQYDFNSFTVPTSEDKLVKDIETNPEKYIEYKPDDRTLPQKVDDCELSISDLEQCIMDMSEVIYG